MQKSRIYLFLLTLEVIWGWTSGIKWLALATSSDVLLLQQNSDTCNDLTGLARRQKKICRRNVEVMGAVKTGAVRAIDECQWQFRMRRWNCSFVDPVTIFGNVLSQGTREAAFVHAISSAGVSHSVTRSCSQGFLAKCGCDNSVNRHRSVADGFQWAGCSENVNYGTAFSQRFVDARERLKGKHLVRGLMNLHNNNAGRLIISMNMKVQCKCHGVSGSCETKTCWRQMPNFREVGQALKEKFDGATEVAEKKTSSRPQLVPKASDYKEQSETDLVYVADSPNFCEQNKKVGSLGTRGRLCNKTSRAIDGCELLCCGRGFETRTRIVEERCRCKFLWCCTVKCSTCKREVEEHFCR